MDINLGAFWLIVVVLIMGALTAGFTRGFVGFLAYVVVIGAAVWLYDRLVVSRPRVQAVGVWEWQMFNGRLYNMEVA